MISAWRMLGSARCLALLFLVYGLTGSVLLAVLVPPLQTPDEPVHAMRAAHLADFRLFGERFERPAADGSSHMVSGGPVDAALLAAIEPFVALFARPDRRAVTAMWQPQHLWSAGRVRAHFVTALYPPGFYLPQTATILAGRAAGWDVLHTLTAARIANGVGAVAIGTLAIGLAGPGAAWIFALLTLPMALSGMATVGPDALILACSALAAALVAGAPVRRGGWVALVAALCLVIATRPAYVGLALVPLACPGPRLRTRLLGVALVLGAGGGWSLLAAATGAPNVGAFMGADPGAQLRLLLAEPWRLPGLAARTWADMWLGYAYSFVGVLGWLDTIFPPWYYRSAGWVLAAAGLATLLGGAQPAIPWQRRALVVGAALASCAGIFGILYLTWTPVGHPVVHGAQGRYFLPLAMLLAAALPLAGAPRLVPLRHALLAAVALFPAVSLAVALHAVVARYYLS